MNLEEIHNLIKSCHYYVYVLKDQGTPFYIGKGADDRLFDHERKAKDKSFDEFGVAHDYNPYKTRKILKILASGRTIEYEIVKTFDNETDAFQCETSTIIKWGRKGIDPNGVLTNRTLGGVGGDTYKGLNEEQRKIRAVKQRLARLNWTPEYAKKIADKIKQTRIKNGTVYHPTPEHIEKCRQSNKLRIGIPSTKKGKPATGLNTKGIRKAWNTNIDKNDPRYHKCVEGMREFHRSHKDYYATLEYSLISPDGVVVKGKGMRFLLENYDVSYKIIRLINKKTDSYKGWIREEDLGKVIPRKRNGTGGIPFKIVQKDTQGNTIKIWDKQRDAAKELGLNTGYLSIAIQKRKSYRGFIWERAD